MAVVVGVITKAEGVLVNGLVARFTGAEVPATNGTDYHATINWGDGSAVDPASVSPDSVSGYDVSGSHVYIKDLVYNVLVSVTGTSGPAATGVGKATIADVAPVVSAPSFAATATTPFSGNVASFTDAGPDLPGQYTIAINWGDGTTSPGAATATAGGFAVSGSHTYQTAATNLVSVSVTTLGGTTGSASNSVKVADPAPVVTARAIAAPVDVPFSRLVATFADADPTLGASAFAATISWGDGLPATAGTIAVVNGALTVSGSHTYASQGSLTTTIVVDRLADHASTTASGTALVTNPVLTASPATIRPAASLPFTGVVATFTDSNAFSQLGDFTATIDWGDHVLAAGTVAAKPGGGGFTVSGTHTYPTPNQIDPVIVTITRTSNGQSVQTTGTATVVEPVLSLSASAVSATAGLAFTAQVGTITDSDPSAVASNYAVTIDWGDGTTSTPTAVSATTPPAAGGSAFAVAGIHTYALPGTDAIRVTATRIAGGQSAFGTSTATVIPSGLVASKVDTRPAAGLPFTGAVATFTDVTPAPTTAYSATIDWGDGTITAGMIQLQPGGGFRVLGTHTCQTPGQVYGVLVTVNKTLGTIPPATESATVTDTATVTIASLSVAAQPVAADAGRPFSAQVATITDTNPSAVAANYTVSIDWGDGTSSAPTGITQGPASAAGGVSFNVFGSHVYGLPGPDTIRFTVTRNADHQVATANSTATVAPASSVVTATGTTIRAFAGVPFAGVPVATFTAPGASAADFVATIAWGDGSVGQGTVVPSGVGFQVQGGHTYAQSATTEAITVSIARSLSGQTVASVPSTAVVLLSSITTFTAQPGVPITPLIATFSAAAPAAAADFTAIISWGDGTPITPGIIDSVAPGVFRVFGMHTYATPSLGAPYAITATITQSFAGGSSNPAATIHSFAVVAIPAFSGGLDPLSDTGPSSSDGVTDINQPSLGGTADPFAIVEVYARGADANGPVPLAGRSPTPTGPGG